MSLASFAVAVRFDIKADHAKDFFEVIHRQARNSLTREPGCHQFDVCVDDNDPSRIFLYETYEDATAFETHRQTEHFAEFSNAIQGWVVDKEVSTWTISKPQTDGNR